MSVFRPSSRIHFASRITERPCGFIGEKGTCLSGGEKQRLALARLWFDNSDIVVSDEATSALDNVTEGIVMKNVLEQIKHAAVIAVAHRLTSIREFDRIIRPERSSSEGKGKKQTLSGIRQPVRQARFRSFPKFLVKMRETRAAGQRSAGR